MKKIKKLLPFSYEPLSAEKMERLNLKNVLQMLQEQK
jgi:hypothetical protein